MNSYYHPSREYYPINRWSRYSSNIEKSRYQGGVQAQVRVQPSRALFIFHMYGKASTSVLGAVDKLHCPSTSVPAIVLAATESRRLPICAVVAGSRMYLRTAVATDASLIASSGRVQAET